jgi:site-specific DNA recombinase
METETPKATAAQTDEGVHPDLTLDGIRPESRNPHSNSSKLWNQLGGMSKAVLYARVSSDRQQKEGTIESQVFELRRQIAAAGHVLIKEYIDDGYTGKDLDRPGLDELRQDIKTDLFQTVYFLSNDRLAREGNHQKIIVAELLKRGKQIIINGQDYKDNPENKFTLAVLGAVAELEREKIVERLTRGKLHHLRKGELLSYGSLIYGLRYIKKTPTSPAALVVHEPEAEVIRSIFDDFVNERCGLLAIARSLETRKIPTRQGRSLWPTHYLRTILKNETYAGTRYCNRYKVTREITQDGRKLPLKQTERDRSEWIAIKVPAIISREVFDKAQARFARQRTGYRLPKLIFALTGLLHCGQCGHACKAYHRNYSRITESRGKVTTPRAAYICGQKKRAYQHVAGLVRPCHNSEVTTHAIEAKVLDMIHETLFDSATLRACTHLPKIGETERPIIAAQVTRLESRISSLQGEQKEAVALYASGLLAQEPYAQQISALDCELKLLTAKAAELKPLLTNQLAVETSFRIFTATAKAHFDACIDFETWRQFLLDHLEKVIYDNGQVSLIGSVAIIDPTRTGQPEKVAFRIDAKITRKRYNKKPGPKGWCPPSQRAPGTPNANRSSEKIVFRRQPLPQGQKHAQKSPMARQSG